MKKRHFIQGACAGFAALGTAGVGNLLHAANTSPYQSYNKVLLVDSAGKTLRADALEPGVAYVFFYPYITTPCFLIDTGERLDAGSSLQTEAGEDYRWQGGIGPNRSIVAYSAICAHKLSHPSKHVSFINYKHQPTNFRDNEGKTSQRSKIIQCCSEHSVYDVRRGAFVMGGPAPQPLAAIDLQYSREDGSLCACGSYGGGKYKDFLEKFGFRLALEFGVDAAATLATQSTSVLLQTLRVADKLGIPVPTHRVLRGWRDIDNLDLASLRLPCYLKPNYSARIIGDTITEFRVRKARTKEHVLDFCRFNLENSPIMLQEECRGVGAGIYLLAREGRILSMVQQVRLHEPLDGGGGSYRITTPMDPKLADYAEAFVSESGWDGVAMIEFKGDPGRADWKLMEVNGRFWGSLALTIRADLNFPLWLYQRCTVREPVREIILAKPKLDVRQRHLKKDVGWFAKGFLRAPHKTRFLSSWVGGFRHLLTGNEGLDTESLRDPLPGLWDWCAPLASEWRRLVTVARRLVCMAHYKSAENTRVKQLRESFRRGGRNILFVCKGNICRSAFAEHYLRQHYGVTSVWSAGTLMRPGRRSPLQVERTALREFGIDMRNHRSKPLNRGLVASSDVIVVMDYRNLLDVQLAHPNAEEVVLLGSLGQGGPIRDPYNQPAAEVHMALERIRRDVDSLAEALGEKAIPIRDTQAQVA